MDLASNSTELRVAAIREHVTIFDIFERMGVDEPRETHQMKCPFHEDKSPSARVYADQNKIYCFTCQRGWDVVDAAQTHLGTSFADTLVWLEQEFAVPGGVQGVLGSIRTKLTTKVPPDYTLALEMVERHLRQHRAVLGFERYTRCLAALDLTAWEAAEKRIKPAEVQLRIQAIQQAAAV